MDNIRRTLRRGLQLAKDIAHGKYDTLLVPINLCNNHWVLIVVNFLRRRLEYYDSMGGSQSKFKEACADMCEFVQECFLACGATCDWTDWEYKLWQAGGHHGLQQQGPGSNCGAWVCQWALAIVLGLASLTSTCITCSAWRACGCAS